MKVNYGRVGSSSIAGHAENTQETRQKHCWFLSAQKVPIQPEYIVQTSRKWPLICKLKLLSWPRVSKDMSTLGWPILITILSLMSSSTNHLPACLSYVMEQGQIYINGSLSTTLSPNLDYWKCRITQLLLCYLWNPWAIFYA